MLLFVFSSFIQSFPLPILLPLVLKKMRVLGQQMDGWANHRAWSCVIWGNHYFHFKKIGIDLCIDLCFGLDMVLSFQTAYFSEVGQTLIYSRQLIAKKYISGWLVIDLASTVPIDKLVWNLCPPKTRSFFSGESRSYSRRSIVHPVDDRMLHSVHSK